MASLSPSNARTYTEAILREIERCIDVRRTGDQFTSRELVLEQIHALKNALASTGSLELLHACEQLRTAACSKAAGSNLDRRYKAIANAGAKLVKQFKQSLPNPTPDA